MLNPTGPKRLRFSNSKYQGMDSTLEPPYLIVTEFLAGGSLFDLLYNSPCELSLWQQVKILLDIASGMRYLHEQKPCILHRDARHFDRKVGL